MKNLRIPIRQRTKLWLGQTEQLYPLYLKWRNPKKRFPCRNTFLTIEGFPRSANTFSLYLAREVFPGKLISSHIHNIASIKSGLRLEVPCIVLIRDGIESVVSLAQKDGVQPEEAHVLAGYLTEWLQMYNFVNERIENLTVVNFRQLVEMPQRFISLMANLKGESITLEAASKMVVAALSKMEAKEDTKAKQGSSLPRKERDMKKAAYIEVIESLEASQAARYLFESLSKKAINLKDVG